MSSIEAQPFPNAAASPNINASFSWWGLLGTFVIFILILVAVLWFIRRLNRSALRGIDSPWARVLDRQVLGGQQSLYLVEIAGKLQVLAGSDHHLTKLTEIEDPDVAAEILEEINHRPLEQVEGAGAWLMKKVLGQRVKKASDFSTELKKMLEEGDQ